MIENQEEKIKEKPYIVSYAGLERCDMIYYLISIGASLGKKILAIDNSEKQDLYAIYEKEDGEEIVVINSLVVAKDCMVSKEDVADYDAVFIYAGHHAEYGFYELADNIILAPGSDQCEINHLRKTFPEDVAMKRDIVLILRDCCNRKLSEKEAARLLGVSAKLMFSLPFDKGDLSNYITLSYSKRAGVYGYLSYEMRAFLKEYLVEVYGITEKQAKKKLK